MTFFLVGFWHGQTSEFLFFGLLQGGSVALNKLYQVVLARKMGRGGYAKLSKNLDLRGIYARRHLYLVCFYAALVLVELEPVEGLCYRLWGHSTWWQSGL